MALITKILETTLAAGATSAVFNDADIPNSLIRIYATNSNIYPLNVAISGTTLTITYEAVESSMGVAVELVKQGLDVVDNLTSTDGDKALSANQGKILKDAIDDIIIPTVPESIGDLDDVDLTGISNGDTLIYDSDTGIFLPGQGGGGATVEDVSNLVTWKTGITLNAGSYKYAYKIGNLVFLYFQADISSGYSPVGTSFQLFVLDNSIKPIAASASYCRGTGNAHAQMTASNTGAINVTCGNWGLGSLFWSIA